MRHRQQGSILIIVMFLVLLVGLFGSAMLTNGPAMARLANQAADEVKAQRAAETGAAYARLRLRQESDWKGDGDTDTVTLPDFKVSERNGNVIGWIRDASGQVSMFRIRFNYQDGAAAGGDDLSDPPDEFKIRTAYLSLNNVRNADDAPVPDVNPVTFKVDDPTVGVNNAPAGCAFLRIQGLSGSSLDGCTGPEDPIEAGNAASRTLRAIYSASIDPGIPESALSAGNGIDLEVENGASVQASTGPEGQKVKLRSKAGVDAQSSTNHAVNLEFAATVEGQIGRDPAKGVNANLVGTVVQADESLGDGKDFHNIKWDEVPKASANPSEAIQLPAGMYVSDFSGVYRYYDTTFADYKLLADDGTTGFKVGGVVLSPNFSELRPATDVTLGGLETIAPDTDNGEYAQTLSITRDMNFSTSSAGVKDVTFMTQSGRELFQDDPGPLYLGSSSLFEFTAVRLKNTKVSSPGDLSILIDVEGLNASLTAEGNATIAAPSVKLEVDSGLPNIIQLEQRLSIYTQKDLKVSTYLHAPPLDLELGSLGSIHIPEFKQYGNLNLQGLLYAWGDAEIYGGTPGQQFVNTFAGTPNYGELNLAGALVAYGGDPAAKSPGVDGKGKISYHGMKAVIDYDASKLVADPAALPPAGIPAVVRRSYGFEN